MNLLDYFFNKRVIVNCDHDPYLTRWFLIRRERFAVYLHRFHRSDEDRALHDHPWSFITIILWRGYTEHFRRVKGVTIDYRESPSVKTVEYEEVKCRRWPGMLIYRPATWRHRVELINGKPSWSLIIRFTKWREWGFWTDSGFVQWNKWWQQNCE